MAGKPWRRDVALTPIYLDGALGETLVFIDCALTAYVPPRLVLPKVGDSYPPAPATEEVRFTYWDWTIRQ